uniref:Uncharacterized protein n=1 Tax=Kingella negevensis TaxID=1522312 RepID=A0A238HJ21_9NEIS
MVLLPLFKPCLFNTTDLPALPLLIVKLPVSLNDMLLFNEYVKFLPDCLITKLSPAKNFTSSPGFTCSLLLKPFWLPLSSVPEVTFQLALLIASATVLAFTNLFGSVVPLIVPFAFFDNVVVLTDKSIVFVLAFVPVTFTVPSLEVKSTTSPALMLSTVTPLAFNCQPAVLIASSTLLIHETGPLPLFTVIFGLILPFAP